MYSQRSELMLLAILGEWTSASPQRLILIKKVKDYWLLWVCPSEREVVLPRRHRKRSLSLIILIQKGEEEEGSDKVLMQNLRIKVRLETRRDCVVFLVSFRCNVNMLLILFVYEAFPCFKPCL